MEYLDRELPSCFGEGGLRIAAALKPVYRSVVDRSRNRASCFKEPHTVAMARLGLNAANTPVMMHEGRRNSVYVDSIVRATSGTGMHSVLQQLTRLFIEIWHRDLVEGITVRATSGTGMHSILQQLTGTLNGIWHRPTTSSKALLHMQPRDFRYA